METPGSHQLWHVPVLGTMHADTIVITWIAMVVALGFFGWFGASYRSARVSATQTSFELVVNYLSDLALSVLGRRGEALVPLFIALFVFIFLLNQVGTFPFRESGLPFGGSPTADLNTTLELGILVFVTIQALGIRRHGISFYRHLARPMPAVLPVNVLEEVLRPVTLALRLFGNIFAGEMLLFIVASVIKQRVVIGPVNVSLIITFIGPLVVLLFNLFVGTIQAFVFTLLTIVYMTAAVADEAH